MHNMSIYENSLADYYLPYIKLYKVRKVPTSS